MDRDIIIYLIFLAIALLGRLLGGKKNQKRQPQGTAQSDRPQQPVMTFEELLEEFTSGKRKPEKMQEVEERASAEIPRARKAAPELVEDDNDYFSYETDFSFESQEKLKSIDELVDIENIQTKSNIEVADEEEVDESVAAGVRAMLQNPEDARRAIILSEILNRKY